MSIYYTISEQSDGTNYTISESSLTVLLYGIVPVEFVVFNQKSTKASDLQVLIPRSYQSRPLPRQEPNVCLWENDTGMYRKGGTHSYLSLLRKMTENKIPWVIVFPWWVHWRRSGLMEGYRGGSLFRVPPNPDLVCLKFLCVVSLVLFIYSLYYV